MQDLCPQKGRCVRVGWQIDMFAGYSGVTPSLWALMGFDAMYMRWAGTAEMFKDWTDVKGFEFIWEGSSTKNLASNFSRGVNNRIFAHIMKHNYGDMSGKYNKFYSPKPDRKGHTLSNISLIHMLRSTQAMSIRKQD